MTLLHCARAAFAAALLMAPLAGPAIAADVSQSEVSGLKSKFIDVDGVRARYYEEGSGEPLVLIHGGFTAGSSTANVWSRNIKGLSEHYRVIAIDRLASGMTDNPKDDSQYNYQGDVEFVTKFINTMKLGKVNLGGHSAGGAIAFYTALTHPEVVKTLIIVARGPANPPPGEGPSRLPALLEQCPSQETYEGLRCRVEKLGWLPTAFDEEYWTADRYMAALPKSIEARKKLAAGAGEPTRSKEYPKFREQMWEKAKSGGVKVPVLMFAAKNDVLDWLASEPTANMNGSLFLYDIITQGNPNVKMVIYNQAGHFMYREYPDQWNTDVIGFLNHWTKAKPN